MSVSNIPLQNQNQKTIDFRVKYKTERCRFWFEKGFCPFNKICAFAHTQQEMRGKRQLNLKYKTKLCHNFFQNGFCKYGDRCQYLHSIPKIIRDGQKTRSNSEQSYSSKSSIQSKQNNKNLNREEFKHRARFEMLKEKDYGLFQIMMGSNSKLESIQQLQNENFNQNGIGFQKIEYYSGLGNSQQKKFRLYSL